MAIWDKSLPIVVCASKECFVKISVPLGREQPIFCFDCGLRIYEIAQNEAARLTRESIKDTLKQVAHDLER